MTTPGHERENALERGVLAPYTWFHGSKGVTFGTCQVFRLFIFFSIFFSWEKKRSQCLGRLDFGPAFSLNVEWHFYKRKKKEKKRP